MKRTIRRAAAAVLALTLIGGGLCGYGDCLKSKRR